jgi:hypothetical protein
MLALPLSLHCSREEGHKQASLHSDDVAGGRDDTAEKYNLKKLNMKKVT